MALDSADIKIIKGSWHSVRQDTVASGCLLFKQLFTRYPQYLQLFPKFPDLDLEHMRDNKRLLKHAVKVIETVSFVVDSLGGDEKQTGALNEALENLVKSHLRRKIGLEKFQALGLVLIDFICDVNHLNGSDEIELKTTTTTTTTTNTNTTTTTSTNNDSNNQQPLNNFDTKSLRLAWAKLYDIILSLVKQEEATKTTE